MSVGADTSTSLEDVASVKEHEKRIARLLEKARQVKPETTIDPPLQLADFKNDILTLNAGISGPLQSQEKVSDHPHSTPIVSSSLQTSLETAARNTLYPLIANLDITSPNFVTVWNLLDILQFCNDLSLCEPGVQLRQIEELLDSQTIDGCKHVCDYLERRRDAVFRLPRRAYKDNADKDRTTKKMQIILLRSCNNLLRRLSRAEDAVFCGRVFIFLFQIYPLGDKSAVNLRGLFHEENVTVFDDLTAIKHEALEESMQIDEEAKAEEEEDSSMADAATQQADPPKTDAIKGAAKPLEDNPNAADISTGNTGAPEQEPRQEETEIDKLYTIFWSLQNQFADPRKLFDKDELDVFKHALATTLEKFKSTPKVLQTHWTPRTPSNSQQGTKRKRNGSGDAYASNFNPKYLTSRDLFELELSDLTFQRHILVQALIIIEFLLSLTPKAKKRTEQTARKVQSAMQWKLTLNEEDTKWAQDTRESIAKYLQSDGPDGKYYYRMADTVLSRDKNWVHWKNEECPPISKPQVPTSEQLSAISNAKRACQNRRIKANPMGAVELSFVSDTRNVNNLDTLKTTDRSKVEGTKTWVEEAERIDLDLEMPGEDEAYLKEGKTTAVWRALRVASRRRFNILDKVDEGTGLDILKTSEHVVNEQIKAEVEKVAEENAVDGEGVEVKVDPPVEDMEQDQIMSEAEPPPTTSTVHVAEGVATAQLDDTKDGIHRMTQDREETGTGNMEIEASEGTPDTKADGPLDDIAHGDAARKEESQNTTQPANTVEGASSLNADAYVP